MPTTKTGSKSISKSHIRREALEAVEAVLETYEEATGVSRKTSLQDLLADLRHYTDARGIDFEEAVAQSRDYYESER